MSPRVAFVADSDAWGGAEVYLTHLMERAEDNEWAASLVCAEPVAERFAAMVPTDRLTVVPLARRRPEAPAIRSAVAARHPDVVAVNLVDPPSNAAALAAGLAVAPTVGVLHLAGDTGSGERRNALAALYRRLAAVVSPSAEGRRQVTSELGVSGERAHVVPNGVAVPAVPSGPAGRSVPRVGALGRLTGQKGFDVLIDAVGSLVADGRPVEVVIGGAGRDEAALRAMAAGLPVTFCGFVTDVRAFLAGLDVFCLSSRHEALPLVLLEAMAEGLPCVATDVGDVAVAVGEDALVVPPGDVTALSVALTAVLSDPARRAGLGVRARRRAVQEMDAGLMAERTFAVLERARRRGPEGSP
ncbi:glycosyltransferase involved in cell wall biosynthesis [Blastococcus colisei]|uniref:Glycosyltransferase involved in cell wall biosynthesis n=1 Tax=Blastococcus colisei TaxID=1564162 RepID=A0A543PGC6_9ACTN|nr:glycosyltransferase family 4 protein [Blastococcus colisei]TQN43123.1 glycosyltransferase involved in cell wall biosynthesis [Blastococcus colisei]